MKNIYNLSNKFRIVKDGVFEFTYKVSLLQFIFGFFLAFIPLLIAFLVVFSFLSNLFSEIPLVCLSFNLWELNYEFSSANRQMYGSINVLILLSLLYVFIALLIRNLRLYNTKNYTVLLDKNRKVIEFSFLRKSVSIHFSELSHFKIKKETGDFSGNAKTTIYKLIIVKKDLGEIELFQLQNNEERVQQVMELLKTELQFGEGEKVVFQNSKLVERFSNSLNNKLRFHKSVSWYFWFNMITALIILFYLTIKIFLPMIFGNSDIISVGVPLVMYVLIVAVFLLISVYQVKVSINRLRFKYELDFTNESVDLIKILKNKQRKLVKRVLYSDILLVRQMPINTNLFTSNFAIAIISKQDEGTLMNSLDCFTSKFSSSIGFHLDKEDYADSVAVENYIETKIMENSGIEVL